MYPVALPVIAEFAASIIMTFTRRKFFYFVKYVAIGVTPQALIKFESSWEYVTQEGSRKWVSGGRISISYAVFIVRVNLLL